MSVFRPNLFLDKYTDFDIDKHIKEGFDTILIDIDNTLDIPDSEKPGTDEAFSFLHNLQKAGFKVIIFSNNTEERVKRFLNGKSFEYYHLAFKPLPFSFVKVIRKYNLNKKKTIVFGDQILTDCLGGNNLGLYTVYVKQLVEKDTYKTVLNRKIEKFILKRVLHEKV